jgi:hypothetical protein
MMSPSPFTGLWLMPRQSNVQGRPVAGQLWLYIDSNRNLASVMPSGTCSELPY